MYDAIIIGARCAGSPAAMLLARKGYKVLLLDKSSFPSDTISTHIIWPTGTSYLREWGLLDKVVATGVPKHKKVTLDFGDITLSGEPPSFNGQDWWITPRRTVLDKILVDAAIEAGVEFRDNCSFEKLIIENGMVTGVSYHKKNGESGIEKARIVIGADGKNSEVARQVSAPVYNEVPSMTCWYYSYWSNFLDAEIVLASRSDCAFGIIPTNDGLTILGVVVKPGQFKEFRKDVEGNYQRAFQLVPEIAGKLVKARREAPIFAMADLPNFFRKPFGPGWALVGDAGYHRDPVTGQGISNAFESADLLATALDKAFSGKVDFETVLLNYQQARDEMVMPMYGLTCDFARLEPPPQEMQELIIAMKDNKEARDQYMGAMIGTVPIPVFFAPQNLERIIKGVSVS